MAQRRQRVFFVGSLGDGSCAEILFEPESLRWDSAPRREAQEDTTGALTCGIGEPKGKRTRRLSITDEHLQPQILAVMAKLGKEGLNAKQLAEHLHQDPLRIRKFIAANAKVLKRVGAGPGTKFHLP